MHILIVDDEKVIRDALQQKLSRAGYQTTTAEDGLDGLNQFMAVSPDLVVLDIVMPKMNGLELVWRIRELSGVPILVLSAQAVTEADIVKGLAAGADEYLVKPVRLNEFVARIEALLRRAQMNPAEEVSSTYEDGYLTVDIRRRIVTVAGEKQHLTPTEFKLLEVLLNRAGHVVPQRELLELVWGKEYIDDIYYPRVYISQLRRKIEPDPAKPQYILTEHRIGYRFERQDR